MGQWPDESTHSVHSFSFQELSIKEECQGREETLTGEAGPECAADHVQLAETLRGVEVPEDRAGDVDGDLAPQGGEAGALPLGRHRVHVTEALGEGLVVPAVLVAGLFLGPSCPPH